MNSICDMEVFGAKVSTYKSKGKKEFEPAILDMLNREKKIRGREQTAVMANRETQDFNER